MAVRAEEVQQHEGVPAARERHEDVGVLVQLERKCTRILSDARAITSASVTAPVFCGNSRKYSGARIAPRGDDATRQRIVETAERGRRGAGRTLREQT